ncbi:unnamed protein product [Amaranthus hypochondriacus]
MVACALEKVKKNPKVEERERLCLDFGAHTLKMTMYEARERLKAKSLVATLVPLQKETEVISYVLMGIPYGTAIQDSPSLTPLVDACSRQDLTAIHEMLEDIGYKDDEWIANELSFQVWTSQIQENT